MYAVFLFAIKESISTAFKIVICFGDQGIVLKSRMRNEEVVF